MRRGVMLGGVALLVSAGVGTALAMSARAPGWVHRELGAPSERLVIEHDDHWAREGFTELTPSLPAPTRRDGSSRIEVWVRIPEGAVVELDEHGAPRLPVGAIADRVERIRVGGRWVVGDVRGAVVEANGARRLRLLRPEHPGPGARLVGYAWPEARRDLGRAAHASLASLVRAGGGLAERARDREAVASLLESRSGCVSCHARGQRARTHTSEGIPFRPTDALGFYTPLAVMRDDAPLERYRPRDLAHATPHVTVGCPEGPPRRVEDDRGGVYFRCDDAALPTGRYDLSAALEAGDARARRVCASREHLYERMSPRAQRAWASAITPCRTARNRTGG
ncbi:MAG: hypothetical protein R3B82_27740 [Sandaracinaceae bacterium]